MRLRKLAKKLRLAMRTAGPACRLGWALASGGLARARFEPDGEVAVKAAMSAGVTIRRDRCGIPHVRAATWSDSAVAIGFLHGCDRLAQLEMVRRLADGRLAEAVGPLALPLDSAARTLGYATLADDYEKRLDAQTRDMLADYARGVNAAIRVRTSRGRLPVEYRVFRFAPQPWTIRDSLLISRLACTDVTLVGKPLLNSIASKADAPLRKLLLPWLAPLPSASADSESEAGGAAAVEWGSNAFAAAGSRTRDGKPLVASDPHIGVQAPSLWYAASVRVDEGDEWVAGLTVPGWPFVVLGRNRNVAWGGTNMLADATDLFIERMRGGQYVVDGQARPLTVREELIPVRGREPMKLRIRSTHRGPIISDSPLLRRLLGARWGRCVSLAWAAHGSHGDELAAFRRMNRARNLAEFEAALATYGQCPLHFIAADATGQIGQFPAAMLPDRPAPATGTMLDGSTSRADWRGLLPGDALPRSIDPPEGFLANSNDAFPVGAPPAIVGPLTCPPFRGNRLRELLAADSKLTPEAALRMQADNVCTFTRELVRRALPLVEGGDHDALRLLRDFDGRMEAGSASAAVAGVFSQLLAIRLLNELLGAPVGARFAGLYQSYPAVLRLLDGAEPLPRPRLVELAREAFAETVHYLQKHQGRRAERWRWGKVLRMRPAGALGRMPILGRAFNLPDRPGDGSSHAVNQARFRFDPAAPRQYVHLGVSARLVMPLGGQRMLLCLATGQSENPRSRHFADQAVMLAEGLMAELTPDGPHECTSELRLLPHE